MVSLVQLWLPILLSAIGVFIASSILHMLLKFWHFPDYKSLSEEDAVRAALRSGSPAPGIYMLPYCSVEQMNDPETRRKFDEGPVGILFLRRNGMGNMSATLTQWFVFCVIVSLFVAFIAATTLIAGPDSTRIFIVAGTVAFMAYAFGAIPYGIWWGQPWGSLFKDVVDGLIYGAITGAIFAWLWPAAG